MILLFLFSNRMFSCNCFSKTVNIFIAISVILCYCASVLLFNFKTINFHFANLIRTRRESCYTIYQLFQIVKYHTRRSVRAVLKWQQKATERIKLYKNLARRDVNALLPLVIGISFDYYDYYRYWHMITDFAEHMFSIVLTDFILRLHSHKVPWHMYICSKSMHFDSLLANKFIFFTKLMITSIWYS